MAEKKLLVRAFKIREITSWMSHDLGAAPSAACTLVGECGHVLGVNDAWASVYEPKVGGWLLVNQSGRAAYRDDVDFVAGAEHYGGNFYRVPLAGDILEGIDK